MSTTAIIEVYTDNTFTKLITTYNCKTREDMNAARIACQLDGLPWKIIQTEYHPM